LHARNEVQVLHARSEKNENKRLCFFPPLPAGTPPKRAGTKAHVPVLRARSEEKEDGLLCFFPPLPAGTKAPFSFLHARSGENRNKRLCFSPPHSRLEPKRVFLSCTRAVTPFETSGFFNMHQRSLCACNKAVRLSKRTALFQHRPSTQNNREVIKNKAALSTKKPRSVPGLTARVQQGRTAFEKGGFISTLFFNAKQPRGHKKIKPLFQQKSRGPCQA